jgi:hypothetical protein
MLAEFDFRKIPDFFFRFIQSITGSTPEVGDFGCYMPIPLRGKLTPRQDNYCHNDCQDNKNND